LAETKDLLNFFDSSFQEYHADIAKVLSKLKDTPSKPLSDPGDWVTLTRWINEYLIREQVERLSRAFYTLSAWVNRAEDMNWKPKEIEDREARIAELKKTVPHLQKQMSLWMQLAWLEGLIYENDDKWRVGDPKKEIESMIVRVLDGQVPAFAGQQDSGEEFLASIAWMMEDTSLLHEPSSSFLKNFPYATQLDDFEKLYRSTHQVFGRVIQHLNNWLDSKNWQRAGKEFTLDTEIDRVRKAYLEQLPMPTPKWKRPDTTFVDFGASSLDFRLDFFIDDIVGEHFGREDDVVTEIREEIVKQFAKSGIEIPFPQQDVWFRNEIKGNWNGQSKK
jgi:hypothetical protein